MNRLKVKQIILTEGKYDAAKLENIIDGLIITTGGYSIFTDKEKTQLIRNLGKQNGVVIITDSDTAGFKIRNYLGNICAGLDVTNIYIPMIHGKEKRKRSFSKEGLLGEDPSFCWITVRLPSLF